MPHAGSSHTARRRTTSYDFARHPGQSPEQIVESLLAEQVRRDAARLSQKAPLTVESFHAWLDHFTAYSERIPHIPGETFSRDMIYQDHD